MLFNSGAFIQFFAAFLLLYYAARNRLAARNLLIVFASYLFYGWWDYRFLSLLLISSLLDFFVGIGLERQTRRSKRKLLVSLSIAGNLTILGFFKYYNFFAESMMALLTQAGVPFRLDTLQIVLPVGISFYTFQTMGYTIDVYRGEMKATRNLIHFMAYVSFFPQLVAGPIERAKHLLPQFKKVVLADNLAPLVEMVYDQPQPDGSTVLLATLAFGIQIYCDFSGYSDIARGVARLLGFDLMLNFNLPYGAGNIREFWRRWHISLSTWLRDYLYVSLGGNRRGAARTCVNVLIVMMLGGLWHGAAWNFVAWGLWHGLGLMIHRLCSRQPDTASSRIRRGTGWVVTMLFVSYGWLLFRAGSWEQIVTLTRALTEWRLPLWFGSYCFNFALFTLPLIAVQLWQGRANDLLAPLRAPRWAGTLMQGTMLVSILVFWEKEKVPFIYFQF